MDLFQASVQKNYLKLQDKGAVAKAYKKYTKYFHNATIQQNIRESKEEQFQQKFLMELFVNVLDYVIFPDSNHNLTTEFKNEKGAQKADGAILKDGKAIAVIELKGTKTKDLEKIRKQAFDYKANQSECVYVITSNFEKFRFYINDAVNYEEFNLFNLTEDRFELFYLCLHKDSILNNLPLKIKQESIVEEESITKKFYANYSLFKRELYRDLVKENIKNNVFRTELQKEDTENANKNIKRTLFKKSQKLIDRFLFIFFAEDRGLLPPNSTLQILQKWKKDIDFGDERPLYDLFKQYFHFLDIGRQGTTSRAEIFAYNGGLFKPDSILDSLIIDDQLLYKHSKALSDYNFESQIDVNILGHIFENSLNEIESINAEIDGVSFDKQTTKRKKDGVFYTPKYITKYIVDNTVGKLCSEKKIELDIKEEEYYKARKGRTTKKLQELKQKLDDYRNWMLTLTILDPACGSGAFLNQALDLLIKEHSYIDELYANLLGVPMVLQDIENTVLEKNIFGVDINEESVEIAKLSLWLRTAQPRRRLNILTNNIKCGNSLIDSRSIAGDKAFNWQNEFPEVFANGGFDVVIGNPPYVSSREISESQKAFFYKKYKTSQYRINLYTLFCELVFSLLRETGQYSLIIPNYWLSTQWDSELREKITKAHSCFEILNTYEVFEDVNVDTVILTGAAKKVLNQKTHLCAIDSNISRIGERWQAIANREYIYSRYQDFDNVDVKQQIILGQDEWDKTGQTLNDVLIFTTGMQPYEVGKGIPIQSQEMRKNKVYHSESKIDETYLPLLGAANVQWMLIKPAKEYIKYGPNLSAMRDPLSFTGDRILMNRILSKEKIDACMFSEDNVINNSDVIVLRAKNEDVRITPILGIITSRYCAYSNKGRNINLQRKVYPKLNVGTLKAFPLPFIDNLNMDKLETLVNELMNYNNTFYKVKTRFSELILASNQLNKISRNLQNWNELEFGAFIIELNKAIKKVGGEKLSKMDEMDWMEVFKTKKTEAQNLIFDIKQTENKIDKMVYELYGLTEEEIKIVEEAN